MLTGIARICLVMLFGYVKFGVLAMEPDEYLARYRVIRFGNITNAESLALAKRGNPTYGWRVDYWDTDNGCTGNPSGYYNDDNDRECHNFPPAVKKFKITQMSWDMEMWIYSASGCPSGFEEDGLGNGDLLECFDRDYDTDKSYQFIW
ncbi:hypothetical protein V1527DRAFT_475482 [Lipomyces starkeyi]